jgi:predicted chitinase
MLPLDETLFSIKEKLMQKITATLETKLKKKPICSSELQPNEMIDVPVGKCYGVDEIEPADGGHSKVILADDSGTFYVFNQHWDGLYVISKQQADAIFGSDVAINLLRDLNQCLTRYQITTIARMRHFLSQIAHESGGLQWLEELDDGSYLEGREDLGNVNPGDGPRFKGAGVIQLTGRSNYEAFAKLIGDSRIMEGCAYVAQTYPFTSAGFWWHNNDMNALCDEGATVEDVTLRVNGGTNGLCDRQRYYDKASEYLK